MQIAPRLCNIYVSYALAACCQLKGNALALPLLFVDTMKLSVYVDGFNLYYGLLRNSPYKWLNPVKLIAQVLPNECEIALLRYFTARISHRLDSDAPRRQDVYIRALETLPEVRIHYGNFIAKEEWRPLTNLPIANRQVSTPRPTMLPPGQFSVTGLEGKVLPVGFYAKAEEKEHHTATREKLRDGTGLIARFLTSEEKGSDVNLAVNLINDAWKGEFDAMAVVTNDTDLVPAISVVVKERKIPVFVVCPQKRRVSSALEKAATYARHINRSVLARSQFPDTLPGTSIQRPEAWR